MLPLFVFSSTMPFFLLLSFFDCAAGLAQLVQRLNAELEIASSILGARPSLVVSRGLNKNNCEMKVLPLPRKGLDASRGTYNRRHKVAVPSLKVGVKIVSSISTLVLNSLTFKESAFFAKSVMFQVHVSLFWFCDDPLTSACPRPTSSHDPDHYPNSKIPPPPPPPTLFSNSLFK